MPVTLPLKKSITVVESIPNQFQLQFCQFPQYNCRNEIETDNYMIDHYSFFSGHSSWLINKGK